MEDWYGICSSDFHDHHGSTLLLNYGNSPSKLVMGILVDHPWQVWKFAYPPRNIWDDKTIVDQYVKYLSLNGGSFLKKLLSEIENKRDNYHILRRAIRLHYSRRLVSTYSSADAREPWRATPAHACAIPCALCDAQHAAARMGSLALCARVESCGFAWQRACAMRESHGNFAKHSRTRRLVPRGPCRTCESCAGLRRCR